jgi:hypothetical protein
MTFIIVIALMGFFMFVFPNLPQKLDCSNLNVIYFKPSETLDAHNFISSSPNNVAVFPEVNKVIAGTEVLKCPNFHYADYINNGGII